MTEYTQGSGIPDSTLEKLWSVRQHDPEEGPIKIKVGPLFREEYRLKNYQTQAVAHLMLLPRMIVADAVGLGKTITAIAGIAYHVNKNPDLKVLIITTKSVARQFQREIVKFSTVTSMCIQDRWEIGKGPRGGPIYAEPHEGRMIQVKHWLSKEGPNVLVAKYSSLIGRRKKFDGPVDENGDPTGDKGMEIISGEMQDFLKLIHKRRDNLLVIFDECHKLKNPQAGTRMAMMQVQAAAARCWGLSASLIKNGADEMYAVMSALGIRPFQSLENFKDEFCVYKMTKLGHKWIPQLTGYKRMDEFKRIARPFIYGRSQRQVKEPLPRLTTQYHELDLDDKQYKMLTRDIPNGDYVLPQSIRKIAGQAVAVDRDPGNMMTMLSVYQLVANHPCLLEAFDEEKLHTKVLSPKEEAMMDLLEGDLSGEKVIVFTKYKTWINRLEHLFKKRGDKFLRITGDENESQREKAMARFQDPDSGYDLIVINSAAMEGVNLQQAAHMICLDAPWSWGDLLQLVGRMLRLASPHSACTLHMMVMKGTVDEYTLATLLGKKGVFEAILGESHSAGLLESEAKEIDLESSLDSEMSDDQFRKMLQAHAKGIPMIKFISGEMLEKSRDNESYVTAYDKKSKAGKAKEPKRRVSGTIGFDSAL